jgi:hypothetical protein
MASRPCEPLVGIFWYFDGRLLTDCTPLSQAEPYGDCLTHPRGHYRYWTSLQRRGVVPGDVEYEEPPRGRVLFDRRRDRFVVLADACILRRHRLVQQIMAKMHLPAPKTDIDRDAHYRCEACLARSFRRADQD